MFLIKRLEMNTMKDSSFWVFSWTTFVRQEEKKKQTTT